MERSYDEKIQNKGNNIAIILLFQLLCTACCQEK